MAGKIVHIEIKAADADRAASFYNNVFGWQFGESVMPEMDYRMTRLDESSGAGLFPSDEAGSGLVVYIDTDDVDASVARVRELGGEAAEKEPIPGVGWFARCRDTEGNPFSLFQADESTHPAG